MTIKPNILQESFKEAEQDLEKLFTSDLPISIRQIVRKDGSAYILLYSGEEPIALLFSKQEKVLITKAEKSMINYTEESFFENSTVH